MSAADPTNDDAIGHIDDEGRVFIYSDAPKGVLLFTAAPKPGAGWRPIAEAPRDGTPVLLWLREPYSRIDLLCWNSDVKGWVSSVFDLQCDEGFCGSLVPSHWMPLPAAPTQEQKA